MSTLFSRTLLFTVFTCVMISSSISHSQALPSSFRVSTGTFSGSLSSMKTANDKSQLFLYSDTRGKLQATFTFSSLSASRATLEAVFSQTTAANVFTFQVLNADGSWATLGTTKGATTRSLSFPLLPAQVIKGVLKARIIAGPSADDSSLDLLVLKSSQAPTPTPTVTPVVTPSPTPAAPPTGAMTFQQVQSYAVQYNNVSLPALEAAPFNMYILDRGDKNGIDWTAAALKPVKAKHFLAGYLNANLAENWRSYWTGTSAPYILGPSTYAGEYFVDLNHPSWIAVMKTYIDELAAMGFQAVFIDNCDAYNSATLRKHYGSAIGAQQATIQFLQTLRSYASSKYGMVLIANNGLDLVSMSGYNTAVDALMYEVIFAGNSQATINDLASTLNIAKGMGKKILDLEVASTLSQAQSYVSQANSLGYIPYVTSDPNYGVLGFSGAPNGVVSGK